ncbi:ABC transporter substrate-binding protein [Fusibacter sp. 3D3]|uniref:ABC transporter substrate-binding protein n=1 Tax=Fusibacter sp. 3D3 TaxID=1048380 RepID=UPI00085371CD|nr:ABC transporter substrate-binding protein [Fusibacter sp. 3D3]GAU78929.1 oligopeptide ABC transporter [Fusibacter sp. 3D3]
MRKKISIFLVGVLLLVTALTGCSSAKPEAASGAESTNGSEAASGAETTPAAPAKDTLIVATGYDAKSLDPHATNDVASSNIMEQIYDTLVVLNSSNEVVGSLAEKFEVIDELTYKFYLKKGVKFHNGEELKAADVAYTFKRATSPIGGSIAHIVGDIDPEGLEIVDDYTIIVRIKTPNSAFLPSLTHKGGGVILNEKAVEAAGDAYAMNPVGTGPFKFESWAKGDQIVLTRFDEYYGEKPSFSKMVIRAIPEATNRTIELESGGVDIAYDIATNDITRIEENKDLKIIRKMANSTTYFAFNTLKAPFDDIKVRQAIEYAIDTETIVQAVWRGVGAPAVGPVPPNIKYFNNALGKPTYDVEKAKALLVEAGYPDGFTAKIWTNDKKARIDMCTIIQNQLAEIGIKTEIQVLEWGAYLEGIKNGDHEMFMVGWSTQTPDPDMSLYGPFHSSQKGKNNFSYYDNPKVDALLEEGRKLADSKERQAIYEELQTIIREEAPWIVMENSETVVGVRSNIEGFDPSPFGYHVLYNVTIK